MIFETDNETILGNGAKSSAFSIQASPKVFKILSSDLYTNKPRAVVRELITNMIDAHQLNGFKGKFKIKVPSELDPRIVFRDFGPGMSDFAIRGNDDEPGLYNSYFASTKAGSNDFIGGFGLGSKSPFSYTDTFNIISYFDGEVRGYTAYQDNNGPQIKPTFVEPMGPDDQTGMEIVVPVAKGDFQTFKNEVLYIMRPLGKDSAEIAGLGNQEVNYFDDFEDVYFIDSVNYSSPERGGLYAVYGGIVYPLEPADIRNTWLNAKHAVTFIKFPMGSLDVTPSRESLSLDERTLKNIKERVSKLDKEAFERDTKEWQESSNVRKVLREIKNLNYQASNYLNSNSKAVKFTSEKLTLAQMINRYGVPKTWTQAGICYEICTDPRLKRIKHSSNSSTVNVDRMFGYSASELYICIDDQKKSRLPLMRALNDLKWSSAEEDKALAKKLDAPGRGTDILFINPENEFEMNTLPDILKKFEGDKVVLWKTSEIFEQVKHLVPVKEPVEREPRPKSANAYRYTFKDNYWALEELFMTASESDEITGYVAFLNNVNILPMNTEYGHLYNITREGICELAGKCGVTEVTFVRPNLQKRIIKTGECECVLQFLCDKFIELIDEVDAESYVGTTSYANRYLAHINKNKDLSFMTKYFIKEGKSTPESILLVSFINTIRPVSFGAYTDKTMMDAFNLCEEITGKLGDAANKESHNLVKEFEKNHRVVSSFMTSNWTLNEEDVQGIINVMKAVEAA